MASTPPPPVIGKSGNLTVFITPPAVTPWPGPETPQSEFSTPPTSPRAVESPASPTPEQPASTPASVSSVRMASAPPPPPPPTVTVSTPPLLKAVSPPLPAEKLTRAPPVQVPPPQFEKASAGPDGSVLSFLWDAVARVQEAHASLDKYISNWFGLDQSKYQWALNNYYERTGQEMDSGKADNLKELSCKTQKV